MYRYDALAVLLLLARSMSDMGFLQVMMHLTAFQMNFGTDQEE